MSRITQVQASTGTVVPSSYDTTNYSYQSIPSNYPLSNAYADTTSTTQARINCTTGRNAETYVYFIFDINIPTTATINSISCKVRAFINTTSSGRFSAYNVQLYSGSTAKGSAVSLSNTMTTHTFTSTQIGSWTAAELNNARLRIYAKRGTSSTSNTYYLGISGSEVEVEYTYNQTVYTVTCTSTAPNIHIGNATDYTHTYEVAEGSNQNIELVGNMTDAVVTDNGVDITSSITPMSGGTVISLTNVQADHTIFIFIPQTGDKIYIKVNGQWKEAQDIKVKVIGSWQSVSKVFKKVNGVWSEQSDKSAMFDQNALYLKG